MTALIVLAVSGGAATTAKLGGHVDVVPISAAFGASMVWQGQVRMLAVTAPARLSDALAEVAQVRTFLGQLGLAK